MMKYIVIFILGYFCFFGLGETLKHNEGLVEVIIEEGEEEEEEDKCCETKIMCLFSTSLFLLSVLLILFLILLFLDFKKVSHFFYN